MYCTEDRFMNNWRERIIYLYMHLDYCFSYYGGTEECPKWHKEMSTCDTGQIKQGIGNLGIEQVYQ